MRMLLTGAALVLAASLGACANSYDRYGAGYGYAEYSGWYGDYYYPGTGFYVYDRYRRPYRWNDDQRRYWEGRRQSYRGNHRDNWNGFTGNDRHFDGKQGRSQAPYRNDGYRTFGRSAVPQDAQPPAYRSGAPERPAGGRDWRRDRRDGGDRSREGYRRPPPSTSGSDDDYRHHRH